MNRIILALDTTNLDEAIGITKKIKDKIFTIKLGLEFFNAHGKEGVKKFNKMGITNLMLDLKLKDIPETVYKAIKALDNIEFGFLTIHGQGGKKLIENAKKAASEIKSKPKVMMVTILTSLSDNDLKDMGNNSTVNEQVDKLAKLAKKVGVEKFVFSSSCSSYGVNDKIVNEESELLPVTAYAKSKVNAEREISNLSDNNFCVTNLRSATAYGLSDSIRLDLVVNNLTCSAFTTNQVKLLSDGTSWRPLVHVDDMSNAFISILKAKNSEVNAQAFNVGSNDDNYTARDIAQIVEKIIPDSKITYAINASKDARSYRVDFTKINQHLGYKTKWNLENGIEDIHKVLKSKNFREEDFKNKKYYRVTYMKDLIDQKKIDQNLFFK